MSMHFNVFGAFVVFALVGIVAACGGVVEKDPTEASSAATATPEVSAAADPAVSESAPEPTCPSRVTETIQFGWIDGWYGFSTEYTLAGSGDLRVLMEYGYPQKHRVCSGVVRCTGDDSGDMASLVAALQSEDVAAARAAGSKVYGRDNRFADGAVLSVQIGVSPAFEMGEPGVDDVPEPFTAGLEQLQKVLMAIANQQT